jgi:hypothetical protein
MQKAIMKAVFFMSENVLEIKNMVIGSRNKYGKFQGIQEK